MCGILGEISFSDQKKDIKLFEESLNLMNHRGPDDSDILSSDYFIFGHRRLSIIDLDSHAKQPMTSLCGNYIIVFNGEIYNYQELRLDLIERGYTFHTSGDTEVLLNSFIEYGIQCVEKFIGMFAFAIYDKQKNEVFVVRDRLGIKPLYYFFDDFRLVFSSEIKSILNYVDLNRELNLNAVSSYLSFRYPILNDTFFVGVSSLEPAHYIRFSEENFEKVEYWNCAEKFKEQLIDKGEDFYLEKLKEILESSIKYRMISDVPIGAFLSGGVDSSIVTAIMAKNSKEKVKTFTIGFKEDNYNEFSYANLIAEKYKTDHTELLLDGSGYIETMEKLIQYKDAPLSVPNEVPLYLMSKELKKYITVVLSGEGADEIFGGYGRIFRSPYDFERIKNIDSLNLTAEEKFEFVNNFVRKYAVSSFDSEIEHFLAIYSYTPLNLKKELLDSSIELNRIENLFLNKFISYFNELDDSSYYNKMMYAFEKVHLVGLLQRVDVTTMATSVEARVPFVDHRLVEFAFTVPLKYKLKWNNDIDKYKAKLIMSDHISEKFDTPKYLLKKAYEDIIPSDVLYRKKMGFPVPLNNWFGGEFNTYAKKILLSDKAKSRNIYNIENISRILDGEELAKNHGLAMKIWMLINLELFNRSYFD